MVLGTAGGAAEQAASRVATQRCEVWGVLNVTPDSFSDGGHYADAAAALRHGRAMLRDGADVIDVGGASSRPAGLLYGEGAAQVPASEELRRVVPVVQALTRQCGARVSIYTTRPEVAAAAIAEGASIVNDVSCASDAAMLDLVAKTGVDYVIMHTRGRGEVTQHNTRYARVVEDVVGELLRAVERAERHGIARTRLWLDPGLGFAKTAEQTIALLAGTGALVATGLRVLSGPSRKGFIAELAPLPDGQRPAPDQRSAGTAAAVAIAVLYGAHAVRVHDVAEGRQAVLLAHALRAQGSVTC